MPSSAPAGSGGGGRRGREEKGTPLEARKDAKGSGVARGAGRMVRGRGRVGGERDARGIRGGEDGVGGRRGLERGEWGSGGADGYDSTIKIVSHDNFCCIHSLHGPYSAPFLRPGCVERTLHRKSPPPESPTRRAGRVRKCSPFHPNRPQSQLHRPSFSPTLALAHPFPPERLPLLRRSRRPVVC